MSTAPFAVDVAALARAIASLPHEDLAPLVDAITTRSGGPVPDLLTVPEAAEVLRCSRQRVHDLTYEGRLPVLRDGRRVLIRRRDIEAHLGGRIA